MSKLMRKIVCVVLTGCLILGCCSTGWATENTAAGEIVSSESTDSDDMDAVDDTDETYDADNADDADEIDDTDDADDTDTSEETVDAAAADTTEETDAADTTEETDAADTADETDASEDAADADDFDAMYDDPEYERPILDSAIGDDLTISASALESTGEIKAYGIDVSKYQKNIDWEKVAAAGVTFAFIRVGYRGYSSGTITQARYAIQNLAG
ncbi:MAG: hypothetical protein LUH07_10385, partial [Lachnospiraceae bacterium]|nr:hypothetical protein [Lachnospiraceae bacterium]